MNDISALFWFGLNCWFSVIPSADASCECFTDHSIRNCYLISIPLGLLTEGAEQVAGW